MAATLLAAALLLGVLSMGFQLVGSRLLAPYYGSSLLVWAFLISTFLAGFSLGSIAGGLLARLPARSLGAALAVLTLVTVAGLGLTAFAGQWVLRLADATIASLLLGTAASCVALFLLPVACFSCWPPLLTETMARRGHRPGLAAGLVYGCSTVGNIAGVMLTAFALIPSFRVSTIVVGWWVAAAVLTSALALLLAHAAQQPAQAAVAPSD